MLSDKSLPQRQYYLDWLRVIAIMTVFIFHTTRFFDQFDWHVKNSTTYPGVQIWTMFQANWGMPLIFMISGASLYFSVDKIVKFIKSKVNRLLIPLVVGVFTHVSIAVYLERVTHYQFHGTFFEFFPKYFQGWYGSGGNFAWMGLHLWYLLVLFVFSLLFLPLFYLLKGPWEKALHWLGNIFSWSGMIYLLALPIMWGAVSINPRTMLGGHNWGGWSVLCYIPFFLYGFLLISHEGMQSKTKGWRWISLGLAVVVTILLLLANSRYSNPFYGSVGYKIVNGLYGLNAWLWVLTILGFGIQYLNFPSTFLYYANEAVLPFYILHQTVLLGIGYYVTRWDIPDLAKFTIILISGFIIVMAIYEFLIRRVNFLRILFGMKVKTKLIATPSPVNNQMR